MAAAVLLETSPCCGALIVLGVLFVIMAILGAIIDARDRAKKGEGSSGQAGPPERPRPGNVGFRLHAEADSRKIGDRPMDCIVVQMQGAINAPTDNCPVLFTLTLTDVTKPGEELPVVTSVPQLQFRDSVAFFWSKVETLPHRASLIQSWTDLMAIPLEALTFPARGRRRLRFALKISAPLGGAAELVSETAEMELVNEQPGYVDARRARLNAGELAVRLAVMVSAVDGELEESEGDVIRRWIDRRVAAEPEASRDEARRVLSRSIFSAEQVAECADPADLEHVSLDMVRNAPIGGASKGDLYDLLELCMEVASADGKATEEELSLIDALAGELDVDRDRFRSMSEKLLPVGMHESADTDQILGVDPSWTPREKKRHLRRLYRKWNAVATHSDPERRKQAGDMLELIARERSRLDRESG
jgi:tellurite resistance protein